MTEKTIETAFGPITLRKPTERETLTKMQKRANVETGKFPVDAVDDGDEEIIDCVTSPERGQLEEWLEDAPRLIEPLERAFDELAGGVENVQTGDRAQVPAELLTQHGKRLVVAQHAGKTYALTRVSRVEFKLIKRQKDYMAGVAQLGRNHLVYGTIDATAWPSLAAQLGTYILQMASKAVEGDVGKSASSSAATPPPKS